MADNNRWTLAEYLKYRYKQQFGKSRPEKPAFVPPLSKLEKMKRINGANRPTPAHPLGFTQDSAKRGRGCGGKLG